MIDSLTGFLAMYGLKVVGAFLILVIGWFIASTVRRSVRRGMEHAKIEATLVGFVVNILYYLILAAAVIAALGRVGVPTASLLAVLGTAGLAVGLALKDSLANFASGVLLLLFRPFRVGDYIEGAGTAGSVLEIQMFQTRLSTPDNKEVIVPNAKLTGDNVTNYNARGTRRVDMVFGISYSDDIDRAKAILASIVEADSRVLKDPAPVIVLLELGESSVNLACRPWVNSADYWDFFFDTQQKVKQRFDQEGISIPFPQRDLHIFQGGGQQAA